MTFLATIASGKRKAADSDELRRLATADPALAASAERMSGLIQRQAEHQALFESLNAEMNLDPTVRARARLRIQLERDEAALAIQEGARAVAAAKAERAGIARRLWLETIQPALLQRQALAVKELNAALKTAAARNAIVQELDDLARELMPSGANLSPMSTFRFASLTSNESGTGGLENWQRFVRQELGLDEGEL